MRGRIERFVTQSKRLFFVERLRVTEMQWMSHGQDGGSPLTSALDHMK
jgi:hypothetical protein